MANEELSHSLDLLIAAIKSSPPTLAEQAQEEADRLIFRLGLTHPVTLPAAMRMICEHTAIADTKLIEATAKAMTGRVAATRWFARRHN